MMKNEVGCEVGLGGWVLFRETYAMQLIYLNSENWSDTVIARTKLLGGSW